MNRSLFRTLSFILQLKVSVLPAVELGHLAGIQKVHQDAVLLATDGLHFQGTAGWTVLGLHRT